MRTVSNGNVTKNLRLIPATNAGNLRLGLIPPMECRFVPNTTATAPLTDPCPLVFAGLVAANVTRMKDSAACANRRKANPHPVRATASRTERRRCLT